MGTLKSVSLKDHFYCCRRLDGLMELPTFNSPLSEYFAAADDSKQHTQVPVTTGTSVLALKYRDGVILAADTLASYGSMARFRSVDRTIQVNNKTVCAASGDIADFQLLQNFIEDRVRKDNVLNDGFTLTPHSLHSYITRRLYYQRCRLDPLWTNFIVGGIEKDEPFLGYASMLGQAYTEDYLAVGFGRHLCIGQMRDVLEKNGNSYTNLSREDALKTIKSCMETLYYRDCRAHHVYKLIVIDRTGVTTSKEEIKGNWQPAHYVRGYD